jgi:hypothetical protein
VVRAASGGLGLSARALRSLQLCLLLFCPSHTGPGGSARKTELAQYWAQRWHFASPRAHLDGSAWAVAFSAVVVVDQRDTY